MNAEQKAHLHRMKTDPTYAQLEATANVAHGRAYAIRNRRKTAAWKKSYTLPTGDAQDDLRHASKPWPSEIAAFEKLKASNLMLNIHVSLTYPEEA